jgi:transcriptional regulator with XRE-family HTH domain
MVRQVVAVRQDEAPAPVRKIRDPEFSRRLEKTLDENPYTHEMHHGRLTWVQRELAKKFGDRGKVSVESVRKWVSGEAKPREDFIAMLAEILEVDTAWLQLGIAPDLTPRDRKIQNAAVDGAVNLIAGLIQINGGHPAFPEAKDARAAKSHIDLYAIIKGAQYAFHVSLATSPAPGHARFVVPAEYADALQLGVIMVDDMTFRIVELDAERIEALGQRKGATIEVSFDPTQIDTAEITSFRNRL